MSDKKSLKEKFLEILGNHKAEKFDSPMAAPAAAAEAPVAAPIVAKTKDGKEISVDKMEAGGMVMIDGAPAPAGVYELEDGSALNVDETGMIIEVKPAVEAAAAPVETPAAPIQAPAPVQLSVEEFTALQSDYNTFKQEYASYKQHQEFRVKAAEDTIAKQDGTITQLLELMKQIVDAPTADAPPAQKKVFSFSKVEDKKKGFARFAAAAAEIANEKKNS